MTNANLADARNLHRDGRLREAEAVCRQILISEPKHIAALHLLALVLWDAGQLGAASENLKKALDLDPSNVDFWVDLGLVLDSMNETQQAVSAFRRALDLRPDLPEPRNN